MKRARATVLLVAGLAVVGAACGTSTTYSGSSNGANVVVHDPAQLVAASAATSTAAKSARISGQATINMDSLPKPLSFSIDGVTSLDNKSADLKMDMSSILGMIPGAPAKLIVEARVVDGVMYMNFGDLMEAVSGGRQLPPSVRDIKWLSMDLSQFKGAGGGIGSSPGSFTQSLEYLRAASGNSVKVVGKEQVRGTDTTHYSVHLTKAQLEAALRDKLQSGSDLQQQALDGLSALGDGMTIDVWIDGDNLVRREQIDVPINTAGQSGSMNMTIDFYDYGTPVDVQAPPASEVRPFTDLAKISAGA